MNSKYALYLDDIRHPPQTGDDWILCRTVASMQELLESEGIPYLASFDYELGRTDPKHCGEDAVKAFLDFVESEADAEAPVDLEVRLHTSSGYGAAKMAKWLQKRKAACAKCGVTLRLPF